jgi:LPS O-antigen subunit length determinant protein (WzzB/FepE family)
MMTEENENYIVTPIETPFVSEKKSEPNRALIIIIATLIGFVFGIFVVLTVEFYKSEKALSNS